MTNGYDTSLGKYIKGVFCLEGEWTGDLRRPSSLEPILQLLRNRDPEFSYVHRFVVTQSEFQLYLGKWTLKKFRQYPILYLACHGDSGNLFFNSSRRDPGVSLDDLEELLRGKCKGRVICLGSCGSLALRSQRRMRFLEETKALAVCGYEGHVDWILSTAFELILLFELQINAPTITGMRAAHARIKKTAGTLVRTLGFQMSVRKVRRHA